MEFDTDRLLEPAKAYNEYYRDKFTQNASEFFDELTKESKIDTEENRKVSEQYRKADKNRTELKSKLSAYRGWRIFFIVLAVAAVVSFIFGIRSQNEWVIIFGAAVAIVSLILIFTVFKKKIKYYTELHKTADEEATKLYNRAYEIISPLLDLFDARMTLDLCQKTVPTLVFDENFNMRRFDYLSGKYGYCADYGCDISTTGVLSGEIIGNPFVFERRLVHKWGTQTYTGSLTIHWTTHYTDSEGHTRTEHHTQTLYASVHKPKPFYNFDTRLVYGNEAAPDLSFSRQMTHCEKLSERKRQSFVKSRYRDIKKLAKRDGDFREIGNEEFDSLFFAANRDHEVQFRLLFTPLAQKNMTGILTGDSPYGDDFAMSKAGCLNFVSSEHAQNWNMNIDSADYYSYDVDICRGNFISKNEEYFKSVFFDFAPLLSIPLYLQMKPHEYIYKDVYERNYTSLEAEVLINRMPRANFVHPKTVTNAILKTSFDKKNGSNDELTVTAYSYRTVVRVDYIPVLGGDGHMHSVPVPWLLYIPLEQQTKVALSKLDMDEREYRHSKFSGDSDSHTFYHGIYLTLGNILYSADSSPEESDDSDADGLDIDEGDFTLN
ncbi:MAG: hypothetical protein J5922_05430 [Clostridia bacterium]|nr:hypothetical protein [Clostridia bacterium]